MGRKTRESNGTATSSYQYSAITLRPTLGTLALALALALWKTAVVGTGVSWISREFHQLRAITVRGNVVQC